MTPSQPAAVQPAPKSTAGAGQQQSQAMPLISVVIVGCYSMSSNLEHIAVHVRCACSLRADCVFKLTTSRSSLVLEILIREHSSVA